MNPLKDFQTLYPQCRYVQLTRDQTLPFGDDEFDIVFCNAVIEHVGSRESQRGFISELVRIGKSVFLTTPNRWHPIEFHTLIPFTHFLPPAIYRSAWRKCGLTFFAEEENLNLLDEKELRAMIPANVSVCIAYHSFLGVRSNIIACLRK